MSQPTGDASSFDRASGALLGLAIGDAIGTSLEFQPRDSSPPLKDMGGGGPFNLKPGQWTDDTSMALCLAETLIAKGALDRRDLMERFARWYRQGEYSCTGRCFDIGNTTRAAIERFLDTGEPIAGETSPDKAGNGSLMRLAPVAIFWHRAPEAAVATARAQSVTTHGASAAREACAVFAELLVEAINGSSKEKVLRPRSISGHAAVAEVARGGWTSKSRQEISSSGYVVHTLEAALGSVARCHSFAEAVLLAANLGDDADTVAAVTGQLAGALWGANSIPRNWLAKLAWRPRIVDLAEQLYRKADH